MKKIFLSHIVEEAATAIALKHALESVIGGVEIFTSSIDIKPGQEWLKVVDEALHDAAIVIVLCSRRSVRRPWINFESGAGWGRSIFVIPVCHGGLGVADLPDPLRQFQGIPIDQSQGCRKLAATVSATLNLPLKDSFDSDQMLAALKPASTRRNTILIDVSHGQGQWSEEEFLLVPNETSFAKHPQWNFEAVPHSDFLKSSRFYDFTGLILASPWRKHFDPDVINAIVDWVGSGGRLLMLGYELGDFHHNANLNQLAFHFGIQFSPDIVAPGGFTASKPYGDKVTFAVADADSHPLTQGLSSIELVNVQTVLVAPGGIEWLRVGTNFVMRPDRTSLQYRNRTFTTPGGATFQKNEQSHWLPVAVEAPQGLCGKGKVCAVGTWDLLRPRPPGTANAILLSRLLDWLVAPN